MSGHNAANLVGVRSASSDIFVFDPPFVVGSHSRWWRNSNFANRYQMGTGTGRRHDATLKTYHGAIYEAHRVLKPGGILVLKCQDEFAGGKNLFTHIELLLFARAAGFQLADLAVAVQSGKPVISRGKQKILRKKHSYLLVLRKARRKRFGEDVVDQCAQWLSQRNT